MYEKCNFDKIFLPNINFLDQRGHFEYFGFFAMYKGMFTTLFIQKLNHNLISNNEKKSPFGENGLQNYVFHTPLKGGF